MVLGWETGPGLELRQGAGWGPDGGAGQKAVVLGWETGPGLELWP